MSGKCQKTAILLTLLILGLFGVQAQTPPSTECTSNPNNQVCLQPYFTDDQNEYLYDRDSSWILSGRTSPDRGGPSIFFGADTFKTGKRQKDDSPSTQLRERYIQNSGKAESGTQQNFGRGTLKNLSTTKYTGQKIESITAIV